MKTIWITGGSSGIGFASAKKFLDENWRVIISSKNNERLEKAKSLLIKESKNKEIYAIKCDIINKKEVENSIKKIINEISNIDIALLNAAAYSPNKSQEFNIENYELLIDVNLKGTLYCIDILKEYMTKNNEVIFVNQKSILIHRLFQDTKGLSFGSFHVVIRQFKLINGGKFHEIS